MSFLSPSNQQDPILKILPSMSIFTGFSNILLVSIQCLSVRWQLTFVSCPLSKWPLSKSAALQGNQKVSPTDPLECKLPEWKRFCPAPPWFKYLEWCNINICWMNKCLKNGFELALGSPQISIEEFVSLQLWRTYLSGAAFSGEIITVVASGFL